MKSNRYSTSIIIKLMADPSPTLARQNMSFILILQLKSFLMKILVKPIPLLQDLQQPENPVTRKIIWAFGSILMMFSLTSGITSSKNSPLGWIIKLFILMLILELSSLNLCLELMGFFATGDNLSGNTFNFSF